LQNINNNLDVSRKNYSFDSLLQQLRPDLIERYLHLERCSYLSATVYIL